MNLQKKDRIKNSVKKTELKDIKNKECIGSKLFENIFRMTDTNKDYYEEVYRQCNKWKSCQCMWF